MREEVDVVHEGVLVHRIDVAEIRNGEEETGGLLTHWLVFLTSSVDVLLSDRRNFLFLLDLSRLLLRGCEDIDGLLILQDVLIRRQHLQNLLFNLKQFFLIGRAFEDQSLFLLLQIWSFLLDYDTQELVIESFVGDHEVYDGYFCGYFG